jgi:hypothetical protein
VGRLIARYSTNRDFTPYNLIDELVRRGLFVVTGRQVTAADEFRQPVEDYIESIHSRNGFSRQRMTPHDAAAFDEQVRRVVQQHGDDGTLRIRPITTVVWGRPVRGEP